LQKFAVHLSKGEPFGSSTGGATCTSVLPQCCSCCSRWALAAEEQFEPAPAGAIPVGDLNGDGIPDLAIAGRSGNWGAVLAVSGADGTDLWMHTTAGVTPELLPVELTDRAGIVAATWTGVTAPEVSAHSSTVGSAS
jgi:hypothetical protein